VSSTKKVDHRSLPSGTGFWLVHCGYSRVVVAEIQEVNADKISWRIAQLRYQIVIMIASYETSAGGS